MELGDFVEVALLGFCVLSSLIVVLAMIWRWRGRRPAHLAPSPIAYAFSFWLIAMVILGGYFLSIRIPGLFDVTLDRVGFFLTVAIALVMIFRRQVLPPTDYLIDLLLLLYLALCVISMGIHGFGNDIPGRSKPWYQFLAGYFFPAIAFWVSKYTLTPERDYPLVFKAIFWLGVYVCFIAFLENYHMRGLALPRYIGDRTILTHLDRARGPFLNAAFNGLFFMCRLHRRHCSVFTETIRFRRRGVGELLSVCSRNILHAHTFCSSNFYFYYGWLFVLL